MPVYFIGMEGSTAIKIGTTGGDPLKRMAELQTGQPNRLFLIGSIPGGRDDEQKIHETLTKFRGFNEWFTGPSLLSFVKLVIASQQWPAFRVYCEMAEVAVPISAEVQALRVEVERLEAEKVTLGSRLDELMCKLSERSPSFDATEKKVGWTREALEKQVARQHRKMKEQGTKLVLLERQNEELKLELSSAKDDSQRSMSWPMQSGM